MTVNFEYTYQSEGVTVLLYIQFSPCYFLNSLNKRNESPAVEISNVRPQRSTKHLNLLTVKSTSQQSY